MEIVYLSDNMNFAETVAQWVFKEFISGIRAGVTYEQVLSAVKNCHKSQMTIRIIALVDGKCVGTAALFKNDLKGRDYTPWLAALYVDAPYRNQKIGRQLIEKIKEIAKSLDYNELFLRTEHASDYYRKLGWQFVESCKDEYGLTPDVFKISL